MAFSRKPPEPAQPLPPTAKPTPPARSAKSAIEVSEGSLIEEAAVLYANNQPDEAAAVLKHALRPDAPEHEDPRVWRMLCDLYLALGKQPEHEKLALEYAMKFERSPPAWRESTSREARTGTTPVNLPPVLDSAVAARLKEAEKALEQKRALRIELGKVQQVEAEGCALLLDFLRATRRAGAQLTLNGVPQISKLLKNATANKAPQPVWLLLLEIYQSEGLQNEFEDLAIEYAVAFELSPPSWETLPTQKATASLEEGRQGSEASDSDQFFFEGATSGSGDPQLQELQRFVEDRRHVDIDLSRLNRLDFACAGSLLALIARLKQEGKTVRIVQPNELVLALLGVLGIDGLATVMRAESS
jgi:ABC-type transporter Mla MlaB component